MKKITIFLFVASFLSSFPVLATDYWIKIRPTVTGAYSVGVDIETNLPEPGVISADFSLKGLRDDEPCICTDFIKIPIKHGKGHGTIDGEKKALNHLNNKLLLPTGEYLVEAIYYPLWDENNAAATIAGINDEITGIAKIKLSGSGQSSQAVKEFLAGQRWVMQKIYSGHPWDSAFWRNKFGELEQVEYPKAGNPNIIKMYYIKSIDMTLQVNALKGKIVTYQLGKPR